MTRLEQIEKSVAALDPHELKEFSLWFETLQAERWDRQFEEDVNVGKLDLLADGALDELRTSRTRLL